MIADALSLYRDMAATWSPSLQAAGLTYQPFFFIIKALALTGTHFKITNIG
jgi:hypothetical protein